MIAQSLRASFRGLTAAAQISSSLAIGTTLLCSHPCGNPGQGTAGVHGGSSVPQYGVVSRSARPRSGGSHDAGGEGLAAGQSVARHPAAQGSRLQLVERVAARRGGERAPPSFPNRSASPPPSMSPRFTPWPPTSALKVASCTCRPCTTGGSAIFHGLDFWAPNVNIFRDPRWGRGQETYGEDPFLTGRMGVAFVTGMQGDDPNYYRVISTPKHFDVHSGPEPTRHFADVDVSRHDQVDTYEPAFRAAIVEGKAGSVMCAYNAINGQPACANQYLLQDLLRGSWGFQGYVVSDCGAVRDIYSGHHYRPTQAQSSAISLERGMDNECVDFTSLVKDDHDYKPYIEAVQQGYLSQSAMDTALVRLFTARIKLGMFDPADKDPYAGIDQKELNSPEHRALARKLAEESMVLLKNDGALPIKPGTRTSRRRPAGGSDAPFCSATTTARPRTPFPCLRASRPSFRTPRSPTFRARSSSAMRASQCPTIYSPPPTASPACKPSTRTGAASILAPA